MRDINHGDSTSFVYIKRNNDRKLPTLNMRKVNFFCFFVDIYDFALL